MQSYFVETLLQPLLEHWQVNHHSLYLGALVFLVAIGLYLLYKGGDWLTDGASGLANSLGASPAVIGLTVVSMATSAPELFTCMAAALKGSPNLVVGNLVGSNLANIGLVLGFVLVLRPLKSADAFPSWQIRFLMISTITFVVLCIIPLEKSDLSRLDGSLCIVLMLIFLGCLTKDARCKTRSDEKIDKTTASKCLTLLVVATIMLWIGSETLIEGSIGLARTAGLSDVIIGLTLVAIGTSLPELAASCGLAIRGEHAILLGNLVGSNIFNMLLVGGITAVVLPFSVPFEMFEVEFPAMVLVTAVLCILLRGKGELSKTQGILLLTMYFTAIVISSFLHA